MSKTIVEYREAVLDDLHQLLELEQCVIEAERPYNASIKSGRTKYYDLENLISSSNSHVIVVENSGSIIGTGYAQIRESKVAFDHDKHTYMGFMYVSSEHRGEGINQQVVNMLIAWSHKNSVHDFYLDVYSQNGQAIKAYQKAGFKPCMLEMKLNTR